MILVYGICTETCIRNYAFSEKKTCIENRRNNMEFKQTNKQEQATALKNLIEHNSEVLQGKLKKGQPVGRWRALVVRKKVLVGKNKFANEGE